MKRSAVCGTEGVLTIDMLYARKNFDLELTAPRWKHISDVRCKYPKAAVPFLGKNGIFSTYAIYVVFWLGCRAGHCLPQYFGEESSCRRTYRPHGRADCHASHDVPQEVRMLVSGVLPDERCEGHGHIDPGLV